jgi:hypothetical protein
MVTLNWPAPPSTTVWAGLMLKSAGGVGGGSGGSGGQGLTGMNSALTLPLFTSVVVWLAEIAHPSPARYVALTPMIVAEDGAELVVVKNSGLHVGT